MLAKLLPLASSLLIACLFSGATNSWALTNLGPLDKTYPVSDVDFREAMRAPPPLPDVDHWLSNLPAKDLPQVESTFSVSWSANLIVEEDITDQEGTVLYPAQTQVHPLKVYQPKAKLLFFNHSTPQLTLALNLMRQDKSIRPVLTSGNFYQVQALIGDRQVFYAYDWLLRRFHIQYLPALIGYLKEYSKDQMTTIYYPVPELDEAHE